MPATLAAAGAFGSTGVEHLPSLAISPVVDDEADPV